MYIHELVDITGANRARYLHHVTANWSPIGQAQRNQQCFGVWGTLGSTGRWPQVVNMWEEEGFSALARSWRHETTSPTLQDPELAAWWKQGEGFRRGGFDRILRPAPWSPTISELCRDSVRGEVYAHDTITVDPGGAAAHLEAVRRDAIPLYDQFGWRLVGAFRTAMAHDDECIVIWAIPTWEAWAQVEEAELDHAGVRAWQERLHAARGFARFLMNDAPLCPLRTGRQPTVDDRYSEEPALRT